MTPRAETAEYYTGAKRVSERLLERKMRNNNAGAKRVSERLLERKMRNNNATVGRRGDTT